MGEEKKMIPADKIIKSPPSILFVILLLLSSMLVAHRLLFASDPLGFHGKSLQNLAGIFIQESHVGLAIRNNTVFCDRSSNHSDVCFMRGDVRIHSPSSSVVLLLSSNPNNSSPPIEPEKIRPYTRKWESTVMANIPELNLVTVNRDNSAAHECDVTHNTTALVFSLGGYTGNVFHAFSNGLIPLYITSQHLDRQVTFVVLKYRNWWYTKYREILSRLSDYPLIDFQSDTRTHCFPQAIVGLRFHDTLAVDPSRTGGNKSILDFHRMLDDAYKQHKSARTNNEKRRPKLVIVARDATRAIENESEVVGLARRIGFDVKVLRPKNTTPLSTIYDELSSCNVMMGVHGAALTHLLFMRPGALFVQIVPLGLEGLSELCFRDVSVKMGIKYEEYRILPAESSLYRKYGGSDPIVRDPASVKARGWEVTKEVYLEGQNVTLELSRLKQQLTLAFVYAKQQV